MAFELRGDDAIFQPTWRERATKVLTHWNRWGWLALHSGQDNVSVYHETEELLRHEKRVT
jgi:hypothetical protein